MRKTPAPPSPPVNAEPAWVNNLTLKFRALLYPGMDVNKPVPERTMRDAGLMTGGNFVLAVHLRDGLKIPITHDDDDLPVISQDIEQAKEWLVKACDWPYVKAKEFFSGFNAALQEPLVNDVGEFNRESSCTVIYWLMLTKWKEVQSLKSVNDLHRWLLKHLAAPVVGDFKRIEKITQRIGLSYSRRAQK